MRSRPPRPARAERLWLATLSGALGALPDHSGQFRVAQQYLRRRRFAPGSVMVQRMRGGARVPLDLADHTQGTAYLTRRYSAEVLDYIVARLSAHGLFVDVGAHVGMLSFGALRRRPDARLIGFEPYAPNADAWERGRELNRPRNAVLERCALGAGDGRARMLAGADSGAPRIDELGAIEVPQTSLDAYAQLHGITEIDVLKLDAEGYEGEILAGAKRLLSQRAIAAIVCELNVPLLERRGTSAAAVTAQITREGYRPVALPAPRWRQRASPDDALLSDVAFERRQPPDGSARLRASS